MGIDFDGGVDGWFGWGRGGDVFVLEEDLVVVGGEFVVDEVDDCGFVCFVGIEEGDDFVLGEGESYIGDGGVGVEWFVDVGDGKEFIFGRGGVEVGL